MEPDWIRAQGPLGVATVALWVVLGSCAAPRAEPSAAVPPPAPAIEPAPDRALAAQVPDTAELGSAGTTGAAPAEYRLGPNDLIDVAVFGADAFSGTHRVGESGEISVPLLGAVATGGLTARELEDTLETRLRSTYMRDPHVTVQVTEMRSHGVSVVGAVNRPGVYQVGSSTTLLEVIAMAAGLAPDAGSTVYVARAGSGGPIEADSSTLSGTDAPDAGEAFEEVDLGLLLESGSAAENVAIRPGDIVQVRPAGLVYVVGEVNRPGGFTIPPGRPMTVLQALAMAQGLGGTAAPGRGMIVREGPGGEREELPVDLQAVLEGKELPPVMLARDVLYVPENGVKSVGLGVVNALVRMVTLRGLVY